MHHDLSHFFKIFSVVRFFKQFNSSDAFLSQIDCIHQLCLIYIDFFLVVMDLLSLLFQLCQEFFSVGFCLHSLKMSECWGPGIWNAIQGYEWKIGPEVIDKVYGDYLCLWYELTREERSESHLKKKYFLKWKQFVKWQKLIRAYCYDESFLLLLPPEVWYKIAQFVAFDNPHTVCTQL